MRVLRGWLRRQGWTVGLHIRAGKFYCLCHVVRACCWNVDAVAAVVLEGWAKVPAVGCFAVPGRAVEWTVVHQYFTAGWGDGVAVVVKVSVEVLVGRQVQVHS